MSANAYEILLGEATRQLDKQQTELDQLRSRAASLVGAIAIATTFLGAGLAKQQSVNPLSWWAIGFFVTAILTAIWTTSGAARRWCFGYDPKRAYDAWMLKAAPPLSVDEMRVELIHLLTQALSSNDRLLRKRRQGLVIASLAVTGEIVCWLINLG